MKSISYALAVFLILIFIDESGKVNCDENELKMLFPIFRHGSRSPTMLIPNDPYNEMWNVIGIGELTDVGKFEQLKNGQLTRQRYNKFFGQIFNDSQLYVQTSIVPRTVMSAQCFTAGLFPPIKYEVWTNETIGSFWQPIPTYSTFNQINSPQYIGSFDESYENPNLTVAQNDLLKAICNATGLPFNQSIDSLDTFTCESFLKYKLPFGLEQYKEEIKDLYNDIFDQTMRQTYPLYAGSVLFDLWYRIDMFNNGTSVAKTVVYSLHDIYVAAVMLALTNNTVGDPPFASTIYIELYGHSDNNDSDYVMLWYRPTVHSEVILHNIVDCGHKCPVEQFLNIIGMLNVPYWL